MQTHTMKYNLIFGGIEQTALDYEEETEAVLKEFIKTELEIPYADQINFQNVQLLHFRIMVLSPIYNFRRILLVNCITSLFFKFHGNNFPYTFVVFVVRKAGNNIVGFAIIPFVRTMKPVLSVQIQQTPGIARTTHQTIVDIQI
jgi:hypothetical protein